MNIKQNRYCLHHIRILEFQINIAMSIIHLIKPKTRYKYQKYT